MKQVIEIVKKFIGDPKGDYKYLGELEKGKHFVSYMFTDDASDGDIMLCVGTFQYLVVEGGKCRYTNDKESEIAMKYIAENLEDE